MAPFTLDKRVENLEIAVEKLSTLPAGVEALDVYSDLKVVNLVVDPLKA